MSNIIKTINRGRKLRKGDVIKIPGRPEATVEYLYKTGEIYIANLKLNNKSQFFNEDDIAKYKLPHLRLVE